jgi:hypothetical protein
VALQIGQEWSPPYAKKNLPTLYKFVNGQNLSIRARLITSMNGYSAEDEQRDGIGQRMSVKQQAGMIEMEIGAKPLILMRLRWKTIEFVRKFIT